MGDLYRAMTAGELLRRSNASDGMANTAAETVAERAVSDATAYTGKELVHRFTVHGPRALRQLREAKPTLVVRWPESDAVITLGEGLRIVVLEATVHLLDIQRAADHPPAAERGPND
jgi:Mycothiol maleylpyruvate isomerase N-terminal domain